MKFKNKQTAFYRSLIFSCLALLLGSLLLWYVNRPRSLKFSTVTVGQNHAPLEFYYPSDWAPADLQTTYESDYTSVTLERRPLTGLAKWIDESIYHNTVKDRLNSSIRVQLTKGGDSWSPGIETEERRIRSILDQLARTGGVYKLQRINFALGPALEVEIQDSRGRPVRWPNPRHIFLVFPVRGPGAAGSELLVVYNAPDRLKLTMRQTAIEIINHVRVVEKK